MEYYHPIPDISVFIFICIYFVEIAYVFYHTTADFVKISCVQIALHFSRLLQPICQDSSVNKACSKKL